MPIRIKKSNKENLFYKTMTFAFWNKQYIDLRMRSIENLQLFCLLKHWYNTVCILLKWTVQYFHICTMYILMRDPIYVNLLSNPFKSCQSNSCPNTALHWCQQQTKLQIRVLARVFRLQIAAKYLVFTKTKTQIFRT